MTEKKENEYSKMNEKLKSMEIEELLITARVIKNAPPIQRLMKDYNIDISVTEFGLVTSLQLIDKPQREIVATILFGLSSGGFEFDQVLENTIKAFEVGVSYGRIKERQKIASL